ncbi:MAG: glycosyltransferase family 4 protein [Rhodospirillales bacterium]|nr:glycosyltransferase family 4 protein [Rhodospirillales bacterium]
MNKSNSQAAPSNVRVALIVNNSCEHDSRVIRTSEALARNGFQVTVFCRASPTSPLTNQNNGVSYHRVPRLTPVDLLRACMGRPHPGAEIPSFSPPPLAGEGINLAKVLRGFLGKYLSDVFIHLELLVALKKAIADFAPVIIHANDLEALPLAAFISKRCRSRIIYDCHEIATEEYAGFSFIRRAWRATVENLLIRRATRVITTSDGFADYLQQRYRINRPDILYNAPEEADEDQDVGSVRNVLGLAADVPLVVFTGMLRKDRGLENIFQALMSLPDFHFVKVGPGTEEYDPLARQLADRLGLGKRVFLLPAQTSAHLTKFIASGDLAVIGNLNSSLNFDLAMPNKLFEALFAGLPLAVSRLAGCRSLIESEHVGLVMDETDPNDMARVIRDVYDKRLDFAPSAETLNRIQDRFGWPKQEQLLIAIYKDVMK